MAANIVKLRCGLPCFPFKKKRILAVEMAGPVSRRMVGRPKQVSDEEIIVAARRCFLERGARVSAADIARELGLTHTTLFNRFGSKEALMIAALGPFQKVPWVAALEAGPDDRPIREQLVEHCRVMSGYFEELQSGFAILRAEGISPKRAYRKSDEAPPPAQALRALTAWLRRAQRRQLLAECDVETLAATILGALHNWAFTRRVCDQPVALAAGERHVERLIDLLWIGIGPGRDIS